MALDDYSSFIRAERERLANIPGVGSAEVTTPSCPKWSTTDIVCHLGWVARWYRYLLNLNEGEKQTEEGLIGAGLTPEGPLALRRPDSDLVDWFSSGVEALLTTAIETSPSKRLKTIYGEHTPSLLMRRMAHEMAIHRWDAEQAVGQASGFEPTLAADGIDELLEHMVPLPQQLLWSFCTFRWAEFGGSGETVHLHATDTADGWFMTIGPATTELRREHDESADAVAKSSVGDLYLLLWKRCRLDQIEVIGDKEVLRRWHIASRVMTA